MPTIGHCRDCRWWRRTDATASPCTAQELERGEHGLCLNDRVKLYDSNTYGGPFLPDGLYAETDWDGHALLTGQDFGCIHWTAIDTHAPLTRPPRHARLSAARIRQTGFISSLSLCISAA